MKKFDVYYDDKFIDSIYAENWDEAEEIYDTLIDDEEILSPTEYAEELIEIEEVYKTYIDGNFIDVFDTYKSAFDYGVEIAVSNTGINIIEDEDYIDPDEEVEE